MHDLNGKVVSSDVAAFATYNMTGLLPKPKTKGQIIETITLLENNRSCLQYQTKAGYESCYTTASFPFGFSTVQTLVVKASLAITN